MPIQDVLPSLGGFENDMSNRMATMETAARQNHVYVGQLAKTIAALSASLEFERRRDCVLEGRMDEYQRIGFNMNQTVQTIKVTQDMRADDSVANAEFAALEQTLQGLQVTVAKAGTAVEQQVAAVEKDVAALHGVKPAEGAVITAAISQQTQQIGVMQ